MSSLLWMVDEIVAVVSDILPKLLINSLMIVLKIEVELFYLHYS
jgi:hypothetical protein